MSVSSKKTGSFTISHIGIIMPALATAGAHLYLGLLTKEELHTVFMLNGLGYLGLLIIFLAPQLKSFHNIIRWILLGYALLTIILWIYMAGPLQGDFDPFDVMVKVTEVILIIQLFLDKKAETE